MLSEVYPPKEQSKNQEEPKNPLEEQLIQNLMSQRSDSENSGSTEEVKKY